ncbi:MAG: heparinase II/III family protein [Clostridia bacterium]|nr:heparinase II/III family protein [Clostridia bacterium]
MKNNLKLLLLAVSLLLCLSLLVACGGDGDGWNPTGKDVTLIAKGDSAKYLCIYEAGDDDVKNAALGFKTKLNSSGLKCIPTIFAHTAESSDYEILFGKTDREASKIAAELLEAKVVGNEDDFHWVFYYRDGKLAIVANNALAYGFAIEDFFEKYLTSNGIVVKDTLKESVTYTAEEYDEYLFEQERLAAEEKKKEHEQYIGELTTLLDAQRTELSTIKGTWNKYADANSATNPELYLFADYTEDMVAAASIKWGSPDKYPIAEHPRLLLTDDTIPQIKRMLREDNLTNEQFKSLVDEIIPNNCVLPEATGQGSSAAHGGTYVHNHSEKYLSIIQAKALAYLLYNDEYYGYQAILYMKNYLMSLEIKSIPSDQCRQYGYVMRTAAHVYDWCYDLLNETDKIQFIAGVENCLCQGKNTTGDKMEVGFPPTKQGAVEGHANEYQILRDYLSFAVAIYGDNSSWYEYVAGRIYNQYLPVRNYYYSLTGVAHQGIGYAFGRHQGDLYSAWVLKVATGENPYDSTMATAAQGLYSYEFAPAKIFNDGDKTGDYVDMDVYYYIAYLNAYVFEDPDMLAMGEYLLDLYNKPCGHAYNGLNTVAYVALRGLCKLEASEDRYASMNLIHYNGTPLGQYIVRNSWGDDNAAAIFMRIKELSSGDHEHWDSGTFEIYYKGMLTSDGGTYVNNGHNHTKYYHDATISHNGLTIYNPSLAAEDNGYYSGGQKRLPSPGYTLQDWLANSQMVTGLVTGRQHGYADEAETQPLYAYIAGDITKAYHSATVEYVGRRMLTVYTGEEEFPMVFFVFDDIAAKSKSFKKSFLLQITSPDEPTIEGKTVITENGGGRLVLTCLSKNIEINGVGGRAYNADGSYDCENSKNYLVNGKQLVPMNNSDDGHWGRVEIVSTRQNKEATFMNVLYVTDKGNENRADVRSATLTNGAEGAIFNGNIAAIFATDRNGAREEISFSVSGNSEIDYYVSGLAAGEWKVTVDGKDCGTYTVDEFVKATYDKDTYLATSKDSEGGLLTFTAGEGNVVLTPVNIDK